MSGDRTTYFANGTIVERLVSGKVTQTNPDGVVIIIYPEDSRKVQIDPATGITLTTYTDGSSKQEDAMSGVRIEVSADGVEKHFMPNGVLLTVVNGKTTGKGKWKE